MRVMIHDKWKFPGGYYIFEKTGSQVDPSTKAGGIALKIINRQEKENRADFKQQARAEVYHNKDINNDGVIGLPPKGSPIEVKKVTKSKKKQKSRYAWK